MPVLHVVIQLAGATMLLLYAVRMVRTGIERSYGVHFQSLMTRHNSRLKSALIGMIMAIVLQSSAAVALLSSGFASSGLLGFTPGLAIILGADLGSAIVVRILSFQLDWLIPVLLAIGGWLFIKTETRHWRQMGRILMGIAFILVALQFLRMAVDPIRDSTFLPALANYLAADFVTAFLVGAALAFVMHSSVAAILMCVTLVQIDAIPFAAGLSLVLGANLGGGAIPLWLARGMSPAARRLPLANLVLRGGWAVIILLLANKFPIGEVLREQGNAMMLIYLHIAFNAALLFLAFPFLSALERLAKQLVPDAQPDPMGHLPEARTALDFENTDQPTLALASLKRELSRMNGLVEEMFAPLLQIYERGDPTQIKTLRAADARVNDCLSGIRDFVATASMDSYSKPEKRTARAMVDYAIRLESAGDLVAKRFTALAEDLHRTNAQFSKDGWKELSALHARISANLKLAGNVLISDDLESARLLKLEKDEFKRAERSSRKRHLKRLQNGSTNSIATSDMHLETLMAFREFNSHICVYQDKKP